MEIKMLPKCMRDSLRTGINITSVPHCVIQLVLNSLDAKSSSVAVRINLLTRKIQVVDNGFGISKSNLKLIGFRYATNKFSSIEENEKRKRKHYTFGHRGESLASIIELSETVTITSCSLGTSRTFSKIFRKGRGIVEEVADRLSSGTTVTIENFLYNMPVRQMIISVNNNNSNICLNTIQMHMERIALIHPRTSFTLRNDATAQILFKTLKMKYVYQTIALLYGKELIKQLRKVNVCDELFSITGFIATTEVLDKNVKNMQLIFVNRMYISHSIIYDILRNMLLKTTYTKCNNNTTVVFILHIECVQTEIEIFDQSDILNITIEFKNIERLITCIKNAVMKIFPNERELQTSEVSTPGFVNNAIATVPIITTAITTTDTTTTATNMIATVANQQFITNKPREVNGKEQTFISNDGKSIIMDMFLKSVVISQFYDNNDDDDNTSAINTCNTFSSKHNSKVKVPFRLTEEFLTNLNNNKFLSYKELLKSADESQGKKRLKLFHTSNKADNNLALPNMNVNKKTNDFVCSLDFIKFAFNDKSLKPQVQNVGKFEKIKNSIDSNWCNRMEMKTLSLNSFYTNKVFNEKAGTTTKQVSMHRTSVMSKHKNLILDDDEIVDISCTRVHKNIQSVNIREQKVLLADNDKDEVVSNCNTYNSHPSLNKKLYYEKQKLILKRNVNIRGCKRSYPDGSGCRNLAQVMNTLTNNEDDDYEINAKQCEPKYNSAVNNSANCNIMSSVDNILNSNSTSNCESEMVYEMSKRHSFMPKGMSPLLEISPPHFPLDEIKWLHCTPHQQLIQNQKNFETNIPTLSDNILSKQIITGLTNLTFSRNAIYNLTVINQWDKKFIVTTVNVNPYVVEGFESKNNKLIVLFDQHGVHERIRFEELMKYYYESDGDNLKSVQCKQPVILQLDTAAISMMNTYKTNFRRLGLFYEIGTKCVAITHIPLCLKDDSHTDTTREVSLIHLFLHALIDEELNWLRNFGHPNTTLPIIVQNSIKLEACKGATKFGDFLTKDQCIKYMTELSLCELPFQCAHGRPTLTPVFHFQSPRVTTKRVNLKKLLNL